MSQNKIIDITKQSSYFEAFFVLLSNIFFLKNHMGVRLMFCFVVLTLNIFFKKKLKLFIWEFGNVWLFQKALISPRLLLRPVLSHELPPENPYQRVSRHQDD